MSAGALSSHLMRPLRQLQERMKGYLTRGLGSDARAGLTVASMAVPQSMAVAELAGMPLVTGLYCALFPMLAYALIGRSRWIMVGPEPTVAVLAAAAVVPLAATSGIGFPLLMGTVAALTGLMLVIAGLARLGVLGELLPRPVRVGYINGVALTLIVGQLATTFGLDDDAGVMDVLHGGVLPHWPTLAIGVSALALILGLTRWIPRAPGALVAITLGIIAVILFGLDGRGVATAGEVASGLPSPRLPPLGFEVILKLLGVAGSVALIAFSDEVIQAKNFALKKNEPISANRELFALGATNLAAAAFQGFVVAASGSRSAVAHASGARTRMAGVFAAVGVGLVLLFFTGVLAKLPKAVLGGLIIAAALGLFSSAELMRLWRIRKFAMISSLMTTVAVLVVGILPGVGLAIALSIADLLWKAARPHDALLGHVPGVDGYHDIEGRRTAETYPGITAYRFDGPLFFANCEHFSRRVTALIQEKVGGPHPPKWLILDAEAITVVDTAAVETLHALLPSLQNLGVRVAIARAKRPIRRTLRQSGLMAGIGEDKLYPTVTAAIAACVREVSKGPTSTA